MKTTKSNEILAKFCTLRKEIILVNKETHKLLCNDLCPLDFDISCQNVKPKDWAMVDEYIDKY